MHVCNERKYVPLVMRGEPCSSTGTRGETYMHVCNARKYVPLVMRGEPQEREEKHTCMYIMQEIVYL
jgi:hypothetical protein